MVISGISGNSCRREGTLSKFSFVNTELNWLTRAFAKEYCDFPFDLDSRLYLSSGYTGVFQAKCTQGVAVNFDQTKLNHKNLNDCY